MANLLYRASSTATTPASTTVKNSPLTNLEIDANFKSLNDGIATVQSGNVATATRLATGRTIALTGDVTYTSPSFDGSGNVTAAATLANSGVTAGTYTKLTVDAKGRVTAGTSLAVADLPFTPVQQGGGVGQNTSKLYIGWSGTNLFLQVDTSNFNDNWPISITGNATGSATSVSGNTTAAIPTAALASGTANSTTYLRGDRTWATVTSGISGVTISDDTTTNATRYLTFTSATTGSISTENVASTKLTFNPSTGSLTATGYNTVSDRNQKDNILPIADPVGIINQIDGVSFNWKSNGEKSYGVIAQELENILPELVTSSENGLSVSYIPLIAILIEAVKTQEQRIAQLENSLRN